MVSKLKFKGDKGSSKKKRKTTKVTDDVGSSRSTKQQESLPTGETAGWTAADSEQDLYGPIMILLPDEEKPICLCADVNGGVYTTSGIDLVAEEGVAHYRAEPNNVEQVFVLVAVGGSKYALKSSHGRYLGVDRYGLLEAKATAINPQQTFTLLKQDAGWAIQTTWGNFISIQSKKDDEYIVHADSSQIGFCETFVVRIQVRYSNSIRNHVSTDENRHISTQHLKEKAGRELSKWEIRKLKNAFKDGRLNEALVDIRQKHKSDTRC